jgi:hypothetical protein
MSITFSEDEFGFMYGAFEQLMSPTASTTDLQQSIRNENKVWELLKCKAAASGLRPSASSSRSDESSPDASP